jgi:hypothetical protein
MATDLTKNPWILDASDIGPLPLTLIGPLNRRVWDGQPQTVSQMFQIAQATWHAPTAAADDMVIFTDINGHEVFRLGPASGADAEDIRKGMDTIVYDGLVLTSLPSGIVHLERR